MGSRWSEMVDTLAEDMTKTDQIAKSTALEYMPEVYTINHAYGTFQVEKAAHVDTSYTMYNTAAVENLFKDEFKFYKGAGKLLSEKINTDKTLAWNKRQIQSIMTQSILQGESIPQITKRLRAGTKDAFTAADVNTAGKTAKQIAKAVEKKNQAAAVRNARTMTTCVENAGRSKAYKRAEDMGINLDKEWVATLDDRTRHEHRLLDGEVVPLDEPFEVDGYSIMFPGDPDAAGHLVYNCRCSLAPALKGKTDYSKDLSTRNTKKMGDKTYNEWKNEKYYKQAENELKSGQHPSEDTIKRVSSGAVKKETLMTRTLGYTKNKSKYTTDRIEAWSGNYYRQIRKYQQGTLKNGIADASKAEKALENYINDSVKWSGGTTYRTIGVTEKQLQAFYTAKDKGVEINMLGTSSWTSDAEYATNHYVEGKKVIFKSETQKNGASIAAYQLAPAEKEVLVSKSAKYKVKDIIEEDGFTYVILEE